MHLVTEGYINRHSHTIETVAEQELQATAVRTVCEGEFLSFLFRCSAQEAFIISTRSLMHRTSIDDVIVYKIKDGIWYMLLFSYLVSYFFITCHDRHFNKICFKLPNILGTIYVDPQFLYFLRPFLSLANFMMTRIISYSVNNFFHRKTRSPYQVHASLLLI